MGEIWSAVKENLQFCLKRFLNGDETFIERNNIKKCVEELESVSRKLDALKKKKKYCENNEIRSIINNHIREIRLIIQSIQFQESSLREKTDEKELLKELRKSLDVPMRNVKKALERAENGAFNLLQNEKTI